MIIVNSTTRQFNIPGADLVFGVSGDSDSEVKYFQCPRYVGNNLDLAACFIRINYRNANGKMDFYLVEDLVVDGENVIFSWVLSQKVTAYKGQVKFVMCAVGPDLKLKWHTTQGTGQVMDGLEPDNSHVESQTADVVAQLVAMVEAQTVAVEEVGAEQITLVKNAAQTAQEASVAEIEAKGVNTLATIPNEYSAVQTAVRGAANAIRKNVSGEAIRVDDVSPLEHYPVISVESKNLFDISQVNTTNEAASYISAVSDTGITITTKDDSTANGYSNTGRLLSELCPHLKKGDTFILSATSPSVKQCIYLATPASMIIYFDTAYVATEDMLNSSVVFYGYSVSSGQTAGECEITNIQLEKGNTATDYTPYSNPTKIAVSACGKNILGYSGDFEITQNGLTIGYNAETCEFTINGTPSSASFSINFGSYLFETFAFPLGTAVTLTLEYISGTLTTESATNVFYLGNSDSAGGGRYNWFSVPFPTSGEGIKSSTATKRYFNRTWLYIGGESDVTFTDYKFRVQLEIGTEGTDYEAFCGVKYTPNSDGTLLGLSAVSPTMSLLADTSGVNIECEYNRDANVVIAEILEKIAALGG